MGSHQMTQDTKCPLCKVQFLKALWCPLAGGSRCPITDQARPTEEQKEKLGMNDAARSSN